MQRLIMSPGPDQEVDHINGDRLDNRRENLRLCSRQENAYNRLKACGSSSAYKGVAWHRRDRVWRAQINRDGVSRHLGSFTNEEIAARAYDAAARELFGEFAWLNFPEVVTP